MDKALAEAAAAAAAADLSTRKYAAVPLTLVAPRHNPSPNERVW